MKFFTRITDSYKKVVVTLGLVVTTNPLMAAVTSPAAGVTETRNLVIQIISVLAIVGGCALGVKGIADIWKISDDIKRGQATVFAYAQPIAMLAVAGGIIYLSTKFGFNIGESGGAS
ncbi:cag pathogenicity island type IV secretion system protein CagC [Helicobacter pylori]|uniref:cag pathogenicity island type IV secretion system protein CagC n=1 Tax=Helicobacter pylori TaxID=210 RepID=UPI0011185528|nr:cag pathogenicity island type IV secretion system protein CagC [Helicobacter pylori]